MCSKTGGGDCTPDKIFSRRNLINDVFLYITLLSEKDLYLREKPRYFNVEDWETIGKDGRVQIEDSIYKLMVGRRKVLMIQM